MKRAWLARRASCFRATTVVRVRSYVGSGLALSSLLALGACGSSDSQDSLQDAQPVVEHYAALLFAGYDDALTSAQQLRDALDPLLSDHASSDELGAARDAWRAARPNYQQTEYARFYNGPIDDPERGNLEAMINPWPLDEATIDYVRGPNAKPLMGGIINMADDYPDIDEQLIAKENMVPGEANVTTGYHALEFLLWGQDFDPDGPGDRPASDYDGDDQHVARRRTYLEVTSQLLNDQLSQVRDAWAPDTADNYRAKFVSMDPKAALGRILVGMGKFAGGELADQRINVAYTSKDQEDEHSCFSDNTNDDLKNDVVGLLNLYYGRYERLDGSKLAGPSLSDLVKKRDAALDKQVREQLEQALADIEAWPAVDDCPSQALQGKCAFDQLLLGTNDAPGRKALKAVVQDLRAVSNSAAEIASRFGIDINSDLSETGGQ